MKVCESFDEILKINLEMRILDIPRGNEEILVIRSMCSVRWEGKVYFCKLRVMTRES